MLPVCSTAATGCSCHSKIPVIGGLKPLSPYMNTIQLNYNNVDKLVHNFSNGVHLGTAFFNRRPTSCFYSNYIGNSLQSGFTSNWSLYRSKLGGVIHKSSVIFVDNSNISAEDDQLKDLISKTFGNIDFVSDYVDPESILSESLNLEVISLSKQETNLPDIVNEMKESTADTIYRVQNVLNQSLDNISSSVKMAITTANDTVDNVIKNISLFLDKSGESAGDRLSGLSDELKEASGRTGHVALEVLRRTIVVIEDSVIQGGKSVGYAYGSAKYYLPTGFQDTLNLSEESVVKVLWPVGTAFKQVNIALEGIEENFGLDPHDPLIPFVLFLGLSATFWGSYRVLKYSGYAGDLSPQSTMELLRGNENVVLVDIRPENLRERDGIPDLRRTARFRYASVTIPEVDSSVKKLLKGGKGIEDSLLAVVIRNLKIVEDRSKVLVMDADGTRSKGVARSLRKLGIKRPYLVQGGFGSWVKEGFRVKELKPETTLTILNEEAEAILEEIKLTPLKLIGLGAGILAAAYSLVEWEKTLQFIAVIGLTQTIYRRVASYQDAEDFKQDVRLLLVPARLGGEAISWAAGKLEPSRNGLPTSPSSSSDVQIRVLQAAAKHESQPPDDDSSEEEADQVVASATEGVKNISQA